MPKESTIQAGCIKYLKQQGAKVYNIAGGPFQSKATPDLLVCYKGHFIGLEVKQPGEKCTKLQARELEAIDQAEGISAVIHSKEEVAQLIKGLRGLSRKARPKPLKSKSRPVQPQNRTNCHSNSKNGSTATTEPKKRVKKEGQGALF